LRARVPCLVEGQHLAREIFERRVYERHRVSLAADAAGTAAAMRPLVVDVGAHVGLFALRALSMLPHSRLLAIEPARRTCALLRANLAANGMGARATVVQAAADAGGDGDGDGRRVRLRYYRNLTSNSTCVPEERERAQRYALAPWRLGAARDEWCAARSLSSILREHGRGDPRDGGAIALLKVDVEGAELDVLRGLAPCDWARVAQVVVEAHAVGDRVQRIVALLRELGGFAHVCAEPDEELAALGLDNFLVYAARSPSLGEASDAGGAA
jgi:FkbM family methyltransferase